MEKITTVGIDLAKQVPALSKWALIVLASLLAIAGVGWAPARRRM
jgi:IPTL-CTERM motif